MRNERPALALQGVNSYYDDSHILQDVSFSVAPGHILALLGRNGAGKTTCMNTVAGLLKPRGGQISVEGRQVEGASPEAICRAGVALVPQGRRIFRSLTVTENLTVARNKTAPTERIRWDIADIFGLFPRLQERKNHPAGLLSGGEQQMLAIGRALMTNPAVLLMDEPTEGLAPQIVAEVSSIIAKLKSLGLTIVLVEQHTNFALKLADEVVIIATGEIALREKAETLAGNDQLLESLLGVH
ncbi:ABC transporter ATP-binding protein [Rhizobium leguminosarum]|uniref:ABC transporter ATP-binding protein n=1 Tax=Rhizobium leguminosarum TaxID=384 RepID=UPI00035C5B05|nr:ABC transporter ATP-binding protein [Rhizobium leguminosarum]NKK56251.1 ATP-binding cassette domain-containing protein [Rhizobium leguminosarum bv. viciae]NKL55007.1 ATP-binding cassette domain-containing protein [Rhizobium leguminosarum bv. viciae]WSH69107.1 ABC transporter ATP-binding protein [Rhizobium ruizarguesonis]